MSKDPKQHNREGYKRRKQKQQLGYDAVDDTKKQRRSPQVVTYSEDEILTQPKRRKLIATTQDIERNYAIAGWMIRRHLDFSTQFDFRVRTEDEVFNRKLQKMFNRWANRPMLVDVTGRFGLAKLIRMAEARRIVDGDCLLVPLQSGQLQLIEGDRIRNPSGADFNASEWIQGVRINKVGRPLEYAIHTRNQSQLSFERTIRALNVFHHGYFTRYDQVRGISPFASAINDLQDLRENQTYALLKSKIANLFGLVTYRDAEESIGEVNTDEVTDTPKDELQVNLGGGPFHLDLGIEDKAELLTSDVPGSTYKDFNELVLLIVLKALDLPMSFLNEGWTNFFGSRGSWLLYERACVDKRADVQELLRKITVWKLQQWLLDETLVLPSNLTLDEIDFEFVPRGMPPFNFDREIKGAIQAIQNGLDSPERICRSYGFGEPREIIDSVLELSKYSRERSKKLLGVEVDLILSGEDQEIADERDIEEDGEDKEN